MVGARLSYPDLSLFQVVAGLRYAFPRAMARLERAVPRVVALHHKVADRPRIAAYVASPRRIPFSEEGIQIQNRYGKHPPLLPRTLIAIATTHHQS